VDIDALIAALGGRYDAEEVEVIRRFHQSYYGRTVPDEQLIEETRLALARWRHHPMVMRERKQLMQLHLCAEDIMAAEKAGDTDAVAETALWMARIIKSLVAEGVMPDGVEYEQNFPD
jgi:hypothetical protein